MYPTRTFRLLEYHGNMLSDRKRLQGFQEAITQKVRGGCRALDIGTGSGILAMLAARAGAACVDAVEAAEVIEAAHRIVRSNGLGAVVRLHRGLSYNLLLTESVDLLITETLGNFGLEEGIIGSVLDARLRLLTPTAEIIPETIRLYVAPVEHPEIHRRIGVWSSKVEGFDMSSMEPDARNLLWYFQHDQDDCLGPFGLLGAVDLRMVMESQFLGRARLGIDRDGMLHGLSGAFEADLAPGVVLSNMPMGGVSSWRQVFLPLDEAWPVQRGDRLEVTVEMWENGKHWRWTVESLHRQVTLSTDRNRR